MKPKPRMKKMVVREQARKKGGKSTVSHLRAKAGLSALIDQWEKKEPKE